MQCAGRPAHLFTKLLSRPIALLPSICKLVAIALNKGVSRLLPSYRQSNCTVARRN